MSTGNNRYLTLFIQTFQALLTQLYVTHTSFLWCGTGVQHICRAAKYG